MHEKKRILVIGAGTAGRIVAHELKQLPECVIVGYLDDDPRKHHIPFEGFPVLGGIEDLGRLCKKHEVDELIVAVPSNPQRVFEKVKKSLDSPVKIRVVPSISSVILGKLKLSDIRDFDPSDFLGRPLVKSEQMKIVSASEGKTFLVTGGAGSIGSEIVEQLLDTDAVKVVAFDAWEEGCFHLTQKYVYRENFEVVIGNVRDRERVDEVVARCQPDVVIHAAAYKHVPLMEENSEEAVKTNVEGTRNVLESCKKYGVHSFVLISTDKAVNPTSTMGKTKRQAELLMKEYALSNSSGAYLAVRFGNVLNSSGSVIPTFIKQIRVGGPVTITDKKMERYFMTIPEAVSLVLQAWMLGENGKIYILDMGEPMKILDLAENMIKFFGYEPYKDVLIEEVGKRPGEKLYEELHYSTEELEPTDNSKIFIAER